MKINGEAIYKTKGSPYSKEHIWGSLTQSKEENSIYLHLHTWTGGDITVSGLVSKVKYASFLDTGKELFFSQDNENAEVSIELPDLNMAERLRIIKLEVDGKEFDLSKGPDFIPPKIEHVTARKIIGTIADIDGVDFTFSGKHNKMSPEGYEVLDKSEETLEFTLNDHVRFRTHIEGDIRSVQGFELEEGKKYEVVYCPYREGNEVEIVTKVE
jgi:alpha-L-fucosidase